MSAPSSAQPETDREIVVSRIIEAPRSLVFEAFTDVDDLSQWWGPKGGITTRSFDFRPGSRRASRRRIIAEESSTLGNAAARDHSIETPPLSLHSVGAQLAL